MEIKDITNQLKHVYGGKPWYGRTILSCLEELVQEDLELKINDDHSIGQILIHMITWRRFVVNVLRNQIEKIELNSEKDWGSESGEVGEIRGAFETSQSDLLDLLNKAKDELLTQQVPDNGFTVKIMLEGLVQHDVYHLGQVLLMKRSLSPA